MRSAVLDDRVKVKPSEALGRWYGAFSESACWDVLVDGEAVGQIWRAERHDGVKCWMQEPVVLGISLPQSYVGGGYSRTTKSGAISDMVKWHDHRSLGFKLDDATIHVFERRAEKMSCLVAKGDRQKWIHLTFQEKDDPRLGAMGGSGWHATGYRGNRMICVHQAATAAQAMGRAVSLTFAEASPDEKRHHSMMLHGEHVNMASEVSPGPGPR